MQRGVIRRDGAWRREVGRRAAAGLREKAEELSRLGAMVGFDGFVDDILDAVRVRRSMAMGDYERIGTITEFAERVRAAAGISTNIELVTRESRFGGNGPLLASGLIGLGMPTMYVGCIGVEGTRAAGAPVETQEGQGTGGLAIHPEFESFARRCGRAVAVAGPGHTDALEFADGKIMFNQTAPVQGATWGAVVGAIGVDPLRAIVREVSLIGMVNWSLCGGVEGIWEGLLRDVLPDVRWLGSGARRRVFVDLSDPAKRSDEDVARGLGWLKRMSVMLPVTLGLNLSEARRVGRVLGVAWDEGAEIGAVAEALARGVCERSGLDAVVVHPREGAGAASASGESAWIDGPVVRVPRISTGAGDHFNAGFAAAQVAGLGLAECAATAAAASGSYVRDGGSPSLERVIGMLEEMPVAE